MTDVGMAGGAPVDRIRIVNLGDIPVLPITDQTTSSGIPKTCPVTPAIAFSQTRPASPLKGAITPPQPAQPRPGPAQARRRLIPPPVVLVVPHDISVPKFGKLPRTVRRRYEVDGEVPVPRADYGGYVVPVTRGRYTGGLGGGYGSPGAVGGGGYAGTSTAGGYSGTGGTGTATGLSKGTGTGGTGTGGTGTGGTGTGGTGTGGGNGKGGAKSDRRLKRRIVLLGRSPRGFDFYRFEYVWGGPAYVGVMAQDILQQCPEAVSVDDTGYFSVDYALLDVRMTTFAEWAEHARVR